MREKQVFHRTGVWITLFVVFIATPIKAEDINEIHKRTKYTCVGEKIHTYADLGENPPPKQGMQNQLL